MPHFPNGSKLAAILALTILAGAAQAQDRTGGRRAAEFEGLIACRGLTDGAARLACYDKAAATLAEAEKSGDIVVVDREQATAARRQAFGFSLPSLSIFDRTAKPEELERITVKVRTAYQIAPGKWALELEDGAVWQQTDSEPMARAPRQGSQAQIRRAAMGSFFINVDGQRAIRAKRVK